MTVLEMVQGMVKDDLVKYSGCDQSKFLVSCRRKGRYTWSQSTLRKKGWLDMNDKGGIGTAEETAAALEVFLNRRFRDERTHRDSKDENCPLA